MVSALRSKVRGTRAIEEVVNQSVGFVHINFGTRLPCTREAYARGLRLASPFGGFSEGAAESRTKIDHGWYGKVCVGTGFAGRSFAAPAPTLR